MVLVQYYYPQPRFDLLNCTRVHMQVLDLLEEMHREGVEADEVRVFAPFLGMRHKYQTREGCFDLK